MTQIKTSKTDPIRVDWLPLPWPGCVGLTFAPGKKDTAAMSGSWDRDLAEDLRRLREEYSTHHLVSLIEDHEFELLGIPDLVEAAIAVGIDVRRFPVRDIGVPEDDGAYARLVDEVCAWARAGENVVIHCRGGVGRTGTLGGCVLVAAGVSGDDALAALAKARGPYCPETDAQRLYVKHFRELR